jgi:hypothetical protein
LNLPQHQKQNKKKKPFITTDYFVYALAGWIASDYPSGHFGFG